MDAEKFGPFIQARRKELGLTQAELAEKLHVTAKAVSRWERGVGFPDIKLLQPLAEALEITLVELMQSKRLEEDIPKEKADALVSETVESIRKQGEVSRKRKALLYLGNGILWAAMIFLSVVESFSDFPLWVSLCFRLTVIYGGSWGLRAIKCILTGEYNQPRQEYVTVEWNWKTWLALLASIVGFVLLLYVMQWGYDGRLPRDVGGVAGVFLMLGGGIACIAQMRETNDE